MAREVRMVPQNWEHPKDENDNFIPLDKAEKYKNAINNWMKEFHTSNDLEEQRVHWDNNEAHYGSTEWHAKEKEDYGISFDEFIEKKRPRNKIEEWSANSSRNYMPEFAADEAKYYQMYENTSEGTPISPPMETKEALAHWLVQHRETAFSNITTNYEEWMDLISSPPKKIGEPASYLGTVKTEPNHANKRPSK